MLESGAGPGGDGGEQCSPWGMDQRGGGRERGLASLERGGAWRTPGGQPKGPGLCT